MPISILATAVTVIACTQFLFGCRDGKIDPGPDPTPDPDTTVVVRKDTSTLTLAGFLNEMSSPDAVTYYPSVAYASRQASSYDRRSKTPGTPSWFSNDDGLGYERLETVNGHTEKVIFDELHPGVISRIWLTSFGSTDVILRFYFDGSRTPSWQVNSFDLQHFCDSTSVKLGKGLAMPGADWIRGSALYLPIPYSKSCKITIEERKDPVSTTTRYYHINYRRYPDNAKIQTFNKDRLESARSKVAEASAELLSPTPVKSKTVSGSQTLTPSGRMTVDLPQGAKAVSEIVVDVSSDDKTKYQKTISGIIVKGSFDGHQTFEVPLTELSGSGIGGYYTSSWRFSANGKGLQTIRWIMPYRTSASIEFLNSGSCNVKLDVDISVKDYTWNSYSLYFHSATKTSQVPLVYWSDYSDGYEWNFATITGGKGIYCGDVYTIDNNTGKWPGEGDEKIWVDDESFPSHFGTGVEDYFSFCGYFRFNTPFSGEPRLDSSTFHGIDVHYRTRNLDAIPFSSSLVFNLEMEAWESGTAEVSSTIFWYGDAGTIAQGARQY